MAVAVAKEFLLYFLNPGKKRYKNLDLSFFGLIFVSLLSEH